MSSFNKWDDVLKLNNIIFYLTNVAKLWFKNHEAEFQTWPRFKARFVEVFGRPAVRLLCAEQRLRERAQQAGENFTSYIEDILSQRMAFSLTQPNFKLLLRFPNRPA